MTNKSRNLQAVVLFAAIGLLASCGKREMPRDTNAHQIKKSEMSVAEQKYGIAPVPNSSVTYQPDVIVVGGGAESIRSMDANGIIWTINASAAHANELVPGKVLFLTNRAVGRVLDVRKSADDLVLVLGPVGITEIVRDADIRATNIPLDFGQALSYTAPDMPGQVINLAQVMPPRATILPAVFLKTAGPVDPAPVRDVSNLVNFKTVPVASSSGVGLSATTDAGGLKVNAKILLHMTTPEIAVILRIKGGSITEASVELTGAAGLTWNFDAGTDVGLKANVSGILTPDTDFSIPLSINDALPIAVTVRQRFEIKTALGVRNSTLSATGDYTFNGGFKVGYFNKAWNVAGPLGFHEKQNLAQTGAGVSLGVVGLNMTHSVKVIAGVGGFGFVAGPYFFFTSAVGLAKTSDIGMLACMRAPLLIQLNGGVGYVIPQSVTKAINFILRALNIKYEYKGEGGLEPSKPLTIIKRDSRVGGCAPAATA